MKKSENCLQSASRNGLTIIYQLKKSDTKCVLTNVLKKASCPYGSKKQSGTSLFGRIHGVKSAANAGDMGSVPGLGRSYMPHNY